MELDSILKPKSMAVIGVSLTNEDHPANVVFRKNYLRHNVKVFGVNAKGGSLRGEKLFTSINEIPEQIDLAAIVTRAEFVPKVMEECIKAGVKGGIIISGGFSETGQGALQERLVHMAREAWFPFIGPNCLGVYAPPYVDTLFVPSERMVQPDKGRVAFVSQSGGILVDHMVQCKAEGVGISTGVSIGNKALIKEGDLMRHFARDPDTDVIAFYLEGFDAHDGRDFVFAASQCAKPIIVLKSGKTPGGKKAVSSHTGFDGRQL